MDDRSVVRHGLALDGGQPPGARRRPLRLAVGWRRRPGPQQRHRRRLRHRAGAALRRPPFRRRRLPRRGARRAQRHVAARRHLDRRHERGHRRQLGGDAAGARARSSTRRTSRRTRTGCSRARTAPTRGRALSTARYTLLDRCTAATLDGTTSAGLPPNWCAISRSSGQIVSFPQIAGADNYGYDAFRVMWRVAVDALWNNEQRAHDYLSRHDFLRTRWSAAQRLDPVYGHDGTVVSGYDDPTIYGGDIGNFLVADPGTAAQLQQRLLSSFNGGAAGAFRRPQELLRAELGVVRAGAGRRRPAGPRRRLTRDPRERHLLRPAAGHHDADGAAARAPSTRACG